MFILFTHLEIIWPEAAIGNIIYWNEQSVFRMCLEKKCVNYVWTSIIVFNSQKLIIGPTKISVINSMWIYFFQY